MFSYAQDAYLETEVLQADGCRLVQILYRSAIDAIGSARTHLSNSDIAGRSREITRAQEILNELAQSLDHSAGDISRNLAELYDYVLRLLIDGNFKQVDPPLAEAQALLTTLLEGWEQCAAQTSARVVSSAPVWETAYEREALDCVG
ncbi:MAG: flagellar export chaperone FliS [Bryobacteraceae bacterium]|nr:flagellar export chaperone FliS [Bryobacteraceae bacterium]